jgi:hypothetical protein|tara:strand:+ start:13986 stop:15668 length:1683 start_codon:yes stop_codon:yes gene_type:complete
MSIEILENTLIKLLVRRGTDADRKNITLDAGELGFTTDTDRLFIGNGTDKGGVVVGNKYKGKAAEVTSLAPCVTGDYAFETDTNTLKVLQNGNGASPTDWLVVSNLLSAGDTSIVIGNDNKITVGTLSAGNFSRDSLGSSLELSSDRISLSSTIKVDNILRSTTTASSFLQLPSQLKINTVEYNFPGVSPTNNTFLKSDASGNLNWAIPSIISTGVAPTTASVLPVGTIVPFASASNDVPYGWLECDGNEYASTSYPELSTTIGIAYNTGGESADHFRVPNLLSKAIYGSENPANSTLMPVTSASHTSPGLSAFGMNFIIKAVGGVTSPTFTIKNNLSATMFNPAGTGRVDKTGVEFNPLSGNLVIERPAPGMVVFENSGTHDFVFPDGINFVKFTVTGVGAKGGQSPGGAAGTVIGNLSAAPGTTFTIEVGEGFTTAGRGTGNPGPDSKILLDGVELIKASGGISESLITQSGTGSEINGQTPSGIAGGVVASSPHILNSYIIKGGSGMMDTNSSGKEESIGGSSYFGNSPAPGGGQGAHAGIPFGPPPTNGVVILEWS